MSTDSSDALCCFFQWYIRLQLFFTYVRGLLEIHVIIAPKSGVPNGNHMNDAVAEVNGSAAPNVTGVQG